MIARDPMQAMLNTKFPFSYVFLQTGFENYSAHGLVLVQRVNGIVQTLPESEIHRIDWLLR